MSVLRFGNFGGEVPRLTKRDLPDTAGQICENLLADTVEFRPLNEDVLVGAVGNMPAGMSAKTLYRYPTGSTNVIGTDLSLSLARSQIAGDQYDRVYASCLADEPTDRAPVVLTSTHIDPAIAIRTLGVPYPKKPLGLVHGTATAEFMTPGEVTGFESSIMERIKSIVSTALTPTLWNPAFNLTGPAFREVGSGIYQRIWANTTPNAAVPTWDTYNGTPVNNHLWLTALTSPPAHVMEGGRMIFYANFHAKVMTWQIASDVSAQTASLAALKIPNTTDRVLSDDDILALWDVLRLQLPSNPLHTASVDLRTMLARYQVEYQRLSNYLDRGFPDVSPSIGYQLISQANADLVATVDGISSFYDHLARVDFDAAVVQYFNEVKNSLPSGEVPLTNPRFYTYTFVNDRGEESKPWLPGDGNADTALKGEKFLRLERRTHKESGAAVRMLKNGKNKPYYVTREAMADTKTGDLEGMGIASHQTVLKEVVYWPANEPIPAKYSEWDREGTWEVRDTKGVNAIMWRDFTKDEREAMGEVDEARFAIAKTLHAMIHDVEVGRYLEWMAIHQAKKEGESIPGEVVEASEHSYSVFKKGTWVRVPDVKIKDTNVLKYGKLSGRYVPGPVWNDLRQVVNGQFQPFGEVFAKVLSYWKLSKTALSPAVHTNNVMSNFVMADWHDVGAAHVSKALRILLAAHDRDGKGVIGRVGNLAARVGGGAVEKEVATEIITRYADSGGDIGSWATQEIAHEQLDPLLESLQQELQTNGDASTEVKVGVFSALQHVLHLKMPRATKALAPLTGKVATATVDSVATEAQNLIDLYQAEDDVFRLAAWLKAKEDGQSDMEAGRAARNSFLDYSINAPWIQAVRATGLPFISFSYRAVPMLAHVVRTKPHKIMKLMMVAGALNMLGAMLAGADDDEERKMLPEEKAGRIWGMVPKLIRMPWNDEHGSPVYLDVRRWVPVGDVFDVGAGHSALPLPPSLMPGGPLALLFEIVLNNSGFTGKPIVLETDTPMQRAGKLLDYVYKAFAPNILVLPNTHATTGVTDALKGQTDAFGRERSPTQAVLSAFGVKLGSYPADVLRRNLQAKALAEVSEIDKNIAQLKRQRMTHRIDNDEFQEKARVELEKKQKIMHELARKIN